MDNKVDELIQQAMAEAKIGNKSKAKSLLTDALKIDKNDARIWYLLSQVLDDVDQKVKCLESAQKLQPDNPQIKMKLDLLKRSAPLSTIIFIIEILALLVSLLSWFVFRGLLIAAWLTLIVAALLDLFAVIKESKSYVDAHSTPPSPSSRQRHSLALIIAATAILVVNIAMNYTFLGYSMRVVFATIYIGNIDCADSSGRFAMCPPGYLDQYQRQHAEYAKNQIIREEGFCYSQLASRLDINWGLIEDLIIGYCMDRPPRCAVSGPLQSTSCPPPP